jgi:hypothetical protein
MASMDSIRMEVTMNTSKYVFVGGSWFLVSALVGSPPWHALW